jgi:hypothetical protein
VSGVTSSLRNRFLWHCWIKARGERLPKEHFLQGLCLAGSHLQICLGRCSIDYLFILRNSASTHPKIKTHETTYKGMLNAIFTTLPYTIVIMRLSREFNNWLNT